MNSGKGLLARNRNFSRLVDLLKETSGLAIAFSGGADSAFLLAAARVADVKTILPVTIVSDFFTAGEKERVIRLGQYLGVPPTLVSENLLDDARVTRNTDRRCYYCKSILFQRVIAEAKKQGIRTWIHGANLDDLKEFRPGMEAARALDFQAPLITAGFAKAQIRRLSKVMGLETWDLPAQSCLATRIPQGEIITREKLVKVERAEACLHELGFGRVRVRCHGNLARIVIDPDQLHLFWKKDVRQEISERFKHVGFDGVSLDLEGCTPPSSV